MANNPVFDRVGMSVSGTPGIGTITLNAALGGYRTFASAGVANTNVVRYLIEDGTNWEIGLGTYTTTGTTLSRDTVLSSSAGGTTKISVTAAAYVYITASAADLVVLDSAGNATPLGTPASGTLTNCTGLPISTGVAGLGTGVAAFLATPSSTNLAAMVTGETGTGNLVFATSPTLVTPLLGTPTSGTLTNCAGLPVGGISATGTPSATTYLRGDGTWSTVSGGVTTLSFGTTGLTPSTATSGAITVAGTLAVANGGTGVTTSTGSGSNVLSTSPTLVTPLLGTPTSGTLTNCTGLPVGGISATGTPSATTYLRGDGTWSTIAGAGVTTISFGTTGLTPSTATSGAVTVAGTLNETNGGTGQSTYTIGDILYADATNSLGKLAGVATGNALISGGVGVAPSWGKIGLTTHISGTLAVGNGGTGATTLTGILKGNGTAAFTAAAAGTDYQAPIGTISGIAKGNGANALTAATARTDYALLSSATAQAATTATIIFSGIPSGVSRVTVMFQNVVCSAAMIMRLGDSTGIYTTGYLASASTFNNTPGNSFYTTGMYLTTTGSTASLTGNFLLTRINVNVWVCSGIMLFNQTSAATTYFSGYLSLTNALTQIQFLNASAVAYGSGVLNIFYE